MAPRLMVPYDWGSPAGLVPPPMAHHSGDGKQKMHCVTETTPCTTHPHTLPPSASRMLASHSLHHSQCVIALRHLTLHRTPRYARYLVILHGSPNLPRAPSRHGWHLLLDSTTSICCKLLQSVHPQKGWPCSHQAHGLRPSNAPAINGRSCTSPGNIHAVTCCPALSAPELAPFLSLRPLHPGGCVPASAPHQQAELHGVCACLRSAHGPEAAPTINYSTGPVGGRGAGWRRRCYAGSRAARRPSAGSRAALH